VFYNTVVAQAQKIEAGADRVTFTFSPVQRALKDAVERERAWLESAAQKIAGRKITIAAVQTDAPPPTAETAPADAGVPDKSSLRQQAMADSGVQALLEVFPAEIRDVEEM
jgi:hypothetical protein